MYIYIYYIYIHIYIYVYGNLAVGFVTHYLSFCWGAADIYGLCVSVGVWDIRI